MDFYPISDTVGKFKIHKLTDFGLTDFLKPYRIVEFVKAEYYLPKSEPTKSGQDELGEYI